MALNNATFDFDRSPLPPVTPVISMSANAAAALIVGAFATLFLLVIATIFVYHVRKDHKHRKRLERRRTRKHSDVEWGRGAELEPHGSVRPVGLCELEQPSVPELGGEEVKELWDESCAKEVDAEKWVVELDGKTANE